MTRDLWRRRFLWLVVVVGMFALGVSVVRANQGQTTYSGRAAVVQATVVGLSPVVLSDTGDLPSEGGALHTSLAHAEVPMLLTADVLHAASVGQKKAARSDSAVATLDLEVAGYEVEVDLLTAEAGAVCRGKAATVTGDAQVVGLRVDGKEIVVSGAPNQTVDLVGALGLKVGQIVINEQNQTSTESYGEMVVNGLHVAVFGVADVVVAHAKADIDCGDTGPEVGDFVTGGGFITGTSVGLMANFGVAGGIRRGEFWGHLNYIDHADGMHVMEATITGYEGVCGETTRKIRGTAEVNGEKLGFVVEVADNGEPGTNDWFSLELENGYAAAGYLEGGNIQLHRPCEE